MNRALAELDVNKILVRIEADAMEEGFDLAEILRDFGYIVVISLDDKRERAMDGNLKSAANTQICFN